MISNKTYIAATVLAFALVVGISGYMRYQKSGGDKTDVLGVVPQNEGEKGKAFAALKSVHAAIKDFDALRIPNKNFFDSFEEIKNRYNEGKYEEVKALAKMLEVTVRAEIDKEKAKPKIAVTIDAGGLKGASMLVDQLIRYLQSSHLKITFFATGKWAEANSDSFRKILAPIPDEGISNELANHTYSHTRVVTQKLTDNQIVEEIQKAEAVFSSLGFIGKPLFRYPGGERTAHSNEIVNSLGYIPVDWTVAWPNSYSAQQIVERVLSKIVDSGIILMHVIEPEDMKALPEIVEKLMDKYRFVFVSELVQDDERGLDKAK